MNCIDIGLRLNIRLDDTNDVVDARQQITKLIPEIEYLVTRILQGKIQYISMTIADNNPAPAAKQA